MEEERNGLASDFWDDGLKKNAFSNVLRNRVSLDELNYKKAHVNCPFAHVFYLLNNIIYIHCGSQNCLFPVKDVKLIFYRLYKIILFLSPLREPWFLISFFFFLMHRSGGIWNIYDDHNKKRSNLSIFRHEVRQRTHQRSEIIRRCSNENTYRHIFKKKWKFVHLFLPKKILALFINIRL